MSGALAHIESKYEVLGKIKEGGMGAIYLVRHRLLGERRVIKVLRPQLEQQEEFHTRFLREARTAIQLRHPNIAQLYDFASDAEGNAYIVMEYIEGLDLRELLRRLGPPPIGLTLEVALQSLAALGFLHRRNMVHRDVSPDNLMLARDADGKPAVKLVDLGIVKELRAEASELTTTGVFIGKLRYAAPEQLAGGEGSTLDRRADLYSFGVVLYELLTGRHPISGESASQLVAGHLYAVPLGFDVSDPDGRAPEELRRAVLTLLAKQPADRFATAEELAEVLRALQPAHPWQVADLERCFAGFQPRLEPVVVSPSTQERLDRQFAGHATPPPAANAAQPTGAADDTAPTRRMVEGVDTAATTRDGAIAPTAPMVPPTAPATIQAGPAQAAPEAGRRRPFRLALAGGLAVVLVAAVVAIALRDRLLAPRGGAAGQSAAATGLLVVHAVPWAEVTAVLDAAGAAQPLPAGAATPLAMALPPGKYTVKLRGGAGGRETAIAAEVSAGETTRCVAAVERLDTERFLAGLGW